MLNRIKIGWPQVAIVAIVAVVFVSTYFLPDGTREELRTDLGYVWGATATFIGPIIRKKLAGEGGEQ